MVFLYLCVEKFFLVSYYRYDNANIYKDDYKRISC